MINESDPVFQGQYRRGETVVLGKWYFWNEIWTDFIGPYDTEQEARQALKEYAEQL